MPVSDEMYCVRAGPNVSDGLLFKGDDFSQTDIVPPCSATHLEALSPVFTTTASSRRHNE
jgi:hypothetical protein